jgi:RimJ/RimL family protein N-acetyltransferase
VPAAIGPRLQLETLVVLDAAGRIVSTREPQPADGPRFLLIRGSAACAWAVRVDVPDRAAEALNTWAAREPPLTSWRQPPRHAERYRQILAGRRVRCGPAFTFPESLAAAGDGASPVTDERTLARHFAGWVPGEIAAGRAPVMSLCEDGCPVSICFCARRSPVAAEAGIETAAPFRGRGLAPRVAAAWAAAVQRLGVRPLYSTDWENTASLAVARRLELIPFATDWSIE